MLHLWSRKDVSSWKKNKNMTTYEKYPDEHMKKVMRMPRRFCRMFESARSVSKIVNWKILIEI